MDEYRRDFAVTLIQLGGGEVERSQAGQTWSRLHDGKGLLSCCWHGGGVDGERKKEAGYRDSLHHVVNGYPRGGRRIKDRFDNSQAVNWSLSMF